MIKLLTLRSSMVMGGALGLATHVQRGLKAIGERSMVYKIGKKTERNTRIYHNCITYQNITIDDFQRLPGNTFIFEPKCDANFEEDVFQWGMDLYKKGKASMFLHDIFDTQHIEILEAAWDRQGKGIFCARPAVLEITGGQRVLLPYWRNTNKRSIPWHNRKHHAAFMSRISNEKKFITVLEANRLLPKHKQIDFWGAANRLHVHYAIKKYPEIEPMLKNKGYQMDTATDILGAYHFNIDITRYKEEYSFIQYVTLEALEAGAVPVVDTVAGEGTLLEDGDAHFVETPEQIAEALYYQYSEKEINRMWNNYDKILAAHDSRKFAKLLVEEMK